MRVTEWGQGRDNECSNRRERIYSAHPSNGTILVGRAGWNGIYGGMDKGAGFVVRIADVRYRVIGVDT